MVLARKHASIYIQLSRITLRRMLLRGMSGNRTVPLSVFVEQDEDELGKMSIIDGRTGDCPSLVWSLHLIRRALFTVPLDFLLQLFRRARWSA